MPCHDKFTSDHSNDGFGGGAQYIGAELEVYHGNLSEGSLMANTTCIVVFSADLIHSSEVYKERGSGDVARRQCVDSHLQLNQTPS